jgi:hypothetical protein
MLLWVRSSARAPVTPTCGRHRKTVLPFEVDLGLRSACETKVKNWQNTQSFTVKTVLLFDLAGTVASFNCDQ